MGQTQKNETATTAAPKTTGSQKQLQRDYGGAVIEERETIPPPTPITNDHDNCPTRTHLVEFKFGGAGTGRCVKRLMTLPARPINQGQHIFRRFSTVRFARDRKEGGERGKRGGGYTVRVHGTGRKLPTRAGSHPISLTEKKREEEAYAAARVRSNPALVTPSIHHQNQHHSSSQTELQKPWQRKAGGFRPTWPGLGGAGLGSCRGSKQTHKLSE